MNAAKLLACLVGGVGMDGGVEMGVESPTKIVCLTQVVNVDDLWENDNYDGMLEDITKLGLKYGYVVNVVIPRPSANSGVGKVFLEYADDICSRKAKVALHGRRFAGNNVVAVYYPEEKYFNGDYDA